MDIPQELSRKKIVTQQQDLNPATGLADEIDEIRVRLPSGGVAQAICRKRFNDANGEPLDVDTKLYRTPDRQLFSGRSVFRCLGCHAYYPRSKGKELQPADAIVNPDMPSIELPVPGADPMMALMMRPTAEEKPYVGFCEACSKRERRKRFWSAIVGVFINPLKAMFPEPPKPEQDVPPIIVVAPPPVQDNRRYRRPPYPFGRQTTYHQPPIDPNLDEQQE